MSQEESGITVIYDDFERVEGEKGLWSASVQTVKKVGVLNAEELASNLKNFCKQMGEIFEGVTTAVKN
jgi:hypothetical protein